MLRGVHPIIWVWTGAGKRKRQRAGTDPIRASARHAGESNRNGGDTCLTDTPNSSLKQFGSALCVRQNCPDWFEAIGNSGNSNSSDSCQEATSQYHPNL